LWMWKKKKKKKKNYIYIYDEARLVLSEVLVAEFDQPRLYQKREH